MTEQEIRAALEGARNPEELKRTWLWITGETRANKDALKAEGFRWSPKKSAWYFHAEPYRKRHRGDFTLDDVPALHGSERFNARRMELA